MDVRAAVAFEAGKPLEVATVKLDGPKAGEVLVEIKATGICHTDEFTRSGADPEGLFPAILGHEGAGVRLARIDGERAVAEQRVDVVVAAEDPALELCVVVHGLALYAPTLWHDGWAMPWTVHLLRFGILSAIGHRIVGPFYRFTEKEPLNTWQEAAPSIYGFYSNVNPSVGYQGSERRLGEFLKRKTLIFNGYRDQVAGMYAGMNLRRYF